MTAPRIPRSAGLLAAAGALLLLGSACGTEEPAHAATDAATADEAAPRLQRSRNSGPLYTVQAPSAASAWN